MFYKKELGQYGEKLALKYYQKLNYRLIIKNYSCRYGELDLVLEKNGQITVVEVKTRSTNKFLWAEETINQQKIQHIFNAYQKLAREKHLVPFFYLEALIIQMTNGQLSNIMRYKI